jgi:DNA-binding LacI/PurR family transcriptional regulator
LTQSAVTVLLEASRLRARSTLHDVAAHAGVSIATASRALNGLLVSQQSLERVKHAASELGYVANDAARSLRNDRTMALGLIFHELSSWKGLELLDALSAVVEQAGYSLLISTARGEPANYDLLMRRFLERRVDGLFCVVPPEGMESPERYVAARVPLISITSRAKAFANQPMVGPSIAKAFIDGNKQLVSFGHKKTAWIEEIEKPSAYPTQRPDPKFSPFEVEVIKQPPPGGMIDIVREIMSRPPGERPTMIGGSEANANAAYAAAKALGVDVPGELNILAICNAGDPRHPDTPLTSIMIDPGEVGRAAGAAMLDWMNGVPPPHDHQVEIAKWVWGATTGPIRG